jgi:hypothetical protein
MESNDNRTKTEIVLNFLSGGKWRFPHEIAKQTGVKSLDSVLSRMWKYGYILASPLIYKYEPIKSNGRWKWSKIKQRAYIIRENSERKKRGEIVYETYDRKDREIIKKQVEVDFTTQDFAKDLGKKERNSDKIFALLKESKYALFSREIANKLGIGIKHVTLALQYLKNLGKVQRSGYFNLRLQKDCPFDDGYLWFVENKHYDERSKKHDILSGIKQRKYEVILRNTTSQQRFTSRIELIGPYRRSSYQTNIMDDVMSIYKDVKKIEISGEVYYYIDGILSDSEIEKQKNYWKESKSKKQSYSTLIGNTHEQFFQIGIQTMWEENELKITPVSWDFRIVNGKKEYRVFRNSRSKRGVKYEFDRILYCRLDPFPKQMIKFVFESKFGRYLDKYKWLRLLEKLRDTYEFGAIVETKSAGSNPSPVEVQVIKNDVIPVAVIPYAGEKSIVTEDGEKISFAQFVKNHGGLIIFTNQIEKYLEKRTGKKINFKKLHDSWRLVMETEEFSTFVCKYLFGCPNPFKDETIRSNEIVRVIDSPKKNKTKEVKIGEFTEPMLINDFYNLTLENPVVVEPKIDGQRVQLHLDKEKNLFKVFTRNGNKKTLENIEELAKEVKCNNCILDGEFLEGRFHIFDVLYCNNQNLIDETYEKRRKTLENIVDKESKSLLVVPKLEVKDEDDIEKTFKTFINMGYEGIVIKDIFSLYIPGARTSRWLKKKEIKSIDLFVHKVTCDESKKYKKWSHELACYKDGQVFVVFNYPDTTKIDEGKIVTVEFDRLTQNGKIRHVKNIRLRDDKRINECNTFEEIMKMNGT